MLMNKGYATIFKGAARDLLITLEDANGDPVDVSTATEIRALFLPESGTTMLERKLSLTQIDIVNDREKILVKIDGTFSATMKKDEQQDFEIEATLPALTNPLVWRFRKMLTVDERLAP